MFNSNHLFIFILGVTIIEGYFIQQWLVLERNKNINFYPELLIEMKRQKPYNGVLIMQHKIPKDVRLQMIYLQPEPRIILAHQSQFYYRGKYNSEIMAVIIMEYRFFPDLWDSFVETLNYMRQIRILMIFVDVINWEELENIILNKCEDYKITNLLIHFLNSSKPNEPAKEFLQLIPYPQYHFQLKRLDKLKEKFFPSHWQDMKGKELLTIPDQILPRSVLYKDDNGQLKFTGTLVKLVTEFAKLYNATLKLAFQPQFNEVIHFTIISNMSKYGELDLPISISPIDQNTNILRYSYVIELANLMVMIPCARRMEINQVFKELLMPQLFSIIIIFITTFSLVLIIMEKLFFDRINWLNLWISDKVIPGILGQSFKLTNSRFISFRLIYVLIFIMGLYVSTSFSAQMQTLITNPPYQREITNYDELRESGKKILMDKLDVEYIEKSDCSIFRNQLKGVITYAESTSMFNKYRNSFNTSYGYSITSSGWKILAKTQDYHPQKTFCVQKNITILDLIPFSIPLESNTLLKEPLDYFIQKIQASGLLHIWDLHVFNDLLRLKKVTLGNLSTLEMYEKLCENDLIIVWMISIIGLSSSLAVFFIELLTYYYMEHRKK